MCTGKLYDTLLDLLNVFLLFSFISQPYMVSPHPTETGGLYPLYVRYIISIHYYIALSPVCTASNDFQRYGEYESKAKFPSFLGYLMHFTIVVLIQVGSGG